MKSPTEHYKKLEKTLSHLYQMIRRVPEHECTTSFQNLKVQSYILLSHAAFEEYLESLARSISQHSYILYKEKNIITKALVSLTAYETVAQIDKDIKRKKISLEVAKNFENFANESRKNFHKQINENHGIRKKNQFEILLPIGVDPEECDIAISNAMEAFGRQRGDIAHTIKIQRTHTRSSAAQSVNTIKDGLIEFDKAACLNIS